MFLWWGDAAFRIWSSSSGKPLTAEASMPCCSNWASCLIRAIWASVRFERSGVGRDCPKFTLVPGMVALPPNMWMPGV